VPLRDLSLESTSKERATNEKRKTVENIILEFETTLGEAEESANDKSNSNHTANESDESYWADKYGFVRELRDLPNEVEYRSKIATEPTMGSKMPVYV
jgi:hypothetical protein